jgi:hypothetical protein
MNAPPWSLAHASEIAVHAARAARKTPATIAFAGTRDAGQARIAKPISTAHQILTEIPAISSCEYPPLASDSAT